ncbi:excalibur calcium-binding domain-containing protein [Pararhodobacter sp. SW119]|uniref:excalibur calcium-binding domain-containing protein n=1 Tax=Pararhodobacter sp. SW119 TaxID=2780075 RepID=UPI001FD7899B|nr:excalibur calcium-binding domain-containing protein [Pararhodobacter sp. SW119]
MRFVLVLATATVALAGCAGTVGAPAANEPAPLRSDVSDQNRFVPPPGGFAGASAAALASNAANPNPMQGTGTGAPAAGFVPIDDDGFAETSTAAAARESSAPNIVDYALRTSHPVGTERYRRSNPLRWQLWERNCTQFNSHDAAQEAFLAAGGPERDRRNLDPDGDGYACWWTPEPFRRAFQADE